MRCHPHLYEINTWPWLDRLSRREGREVRLGSVPGREWDRLAARGIDLVYLMGVWRRSRTGRQIARSEPALFRAYDEAVPGWHVRDVVGSAFSVSAYEPDPRIGTWDDLANARAELHRRGMRLVVDFIPNHTGFDHRWIVDDPDRYLQGDEAAFRRDPAAFRVVEDEAGRVRFIACARDPFFPPWTDSAQLNYFSEDTREAMVAELKRVAAHADGARCDMAMLVVGDVFARTWSHLLTGSPPAPEFWTKARAAVPGFTLIGEVYWDLEWRLQQLGFDFTYDKVLYDRLLHGRPEDVRAHLRADLEYQRRSARFIENHDEARSAAAFGDRVRAAAVVMSTVPGLRFYHDGQFEGRRARLPVQLAVEPEEPVDEGLAEFYGRLLAAADAPVFHDGDWRLLEVAACDETASLIAAWQWAADGELRVVAVNLGSTAAQGRVLADIGGSSEEIVFDDLLAGRSYRWLRGDVERQGLYVRLEPGRAHLFRVRAAEVVK